MNVGPRHGLGLDAAVQGGLKHALLHLGVLTNATTAAPQTQLPRSGVEEIEQILSAANKGAAAGSGTPA